MTTVKAPALPWVTSYLPPFEQGFYNRQCLEFSWNYSQYPTSLKNHLADWSETVSFDVKETLSVEPCLMNLALGMSDQYRGT